MFHAPPTRRRLTAAVTTVLTATLGAGALTVPAAAAPVVTRTAVTVDAATAPVPFPKNHRLLAAGVGGFLIESSDGYLRHFARYADGSLVDHGFPTAMRSTRTTDFLVYQQRHKVTLRNLSTGSVLDVPLETAPGTTYAGSAANALFTTTHPASGMVLYKHTEEGGAERVAGLPAGVTQLTLLPGAPGEALVVFVTGRTAAWGRIDLATNTVEEIDVAGIPAGASFKAASETHLAWAKDTAGSRPAIFLLDRATGSVQEIPVEGTWGNNFQVGLTGGWVVYGDPGGLYYSGSLNALTAYNPVTRAKVKLLDHLTSSAVAPDGSLYVRGGSLTKGGEGVYRIAAAENGAPTATLVATTGEPTRLEITGNNVPGTVDLDKNAGRAKFTWNLSRTGAEVTLTMRHTRTGQTQTFYDYPQSTPSTTFEWQGEYNGDYTWKLTARPLNGLGPAATATGSFTVTRTPKPHDFDDNGAPDVLFRDGSGRLWRADTLYEQQFQADPHRLVGGGWQTYDRIEAAGNIAGSTAADLVARDRSGVLWLYRGDGRGNFGTRTRIGGGWQTYDRLAGGSDLTGDGRADLVAADRTGVLYLYPGTGNASAPYGIRKRIGGGWQAYNQLVAVGNIAGGAAGDLVARDKGGVLWLYLGKGDGTFADRVRIGGGWNAYTELVGVGDADRDGRPDLYATGPGGEYLYRGTGDWKVPLRPAQLAGLQAFGGGPYNTVV
ncbi:MULTISPECIES: FG-GAP repeat domain-containing protein [unclassified Streptomyces]|uniref:FG-GAP repeat domain-containing protein n=1 Tax=unclassified Streptomyces TaxID=2593676 RepID=UPI0035D770DA